MNSLITAYHANKALLWDSLRTHMYISFTAVLCGMLIAIPLGILLTRNRAVGQKVLAVVGVLQTVPSMVMFGLLIPLVGIGRPTALIVLTMYSILPILRNTYTGLVEVPPNYSEAAVGMGMNGAQVLFKVKLPIALPVIIAGIRLSGVYIISWATVAAIVGGGGLGDLIWMGLSRNRHEITLLGAIPSSLLAITTSFVIGQIAKIATPKGMKQQKGV